MLPTPELLAAEKARLMAATVGFVMMKTAPWVSDDLHGIANCDEIHAGQFKVHLNALVSEPFDTLDDLVKRWIID